MTDRGTTADDPLWYKDAVIYQLHVKAYFDANGDGIGDLAGLTAKLDYIRDLGVNTVWLLPFYPSPMRDDGYDVADYRNVHPQYGTRNDLRNFVREAHRRGLRVITELVINHTSDQHPWFQAARRAPRGSSKRDFYVWSDDPNRYAGTRIIFNDAEDSNWEWDPVAGQYYWHRFFRHQPDLNFDNPHVLEAVVRIMRFWLDMGVDGFRLDAISFLCEREGTSNENLPETHAVIKRIRAKLDERHTDRLLLAEANQWPEDVREYFGDGDECHMAYHFPLMPRMYMAIAQEDRHPIIEIMQQTPEIPETCQWAIFLRSHDELLLDMVTVRERDYMFRTYAVDDRARLNLGIRRRLAPLMENDRNRIKLMNSLLLSMPGSPVIYYGDEIGMGDNIFLGDRDGIRTPMQWSPDRNGGFSHADPQRLYLPPIMDPVYGYEAVNVEAQLRDASSLLHWMRRVLAVRATSRAFGRGRLTFLTPGNRRILAYLREYDEGGEAPDGAARETILCVANLSRTAQPVELALERFRDRVPIEMMGRTAFPPIGALPYFLTLPVYGFYWFHLAHDAEGPLWYEEHLLRDDLPLIVMFDGWASLFRDRVVPWRIRMAEKTREQIECQVLPDYIGRQRWFNQPGVSPAQARLHEFDVLTGNGSSWLMAIVQTSGAPGNDDAFAPASYFLPLSLVWGDMEEAPVHTLGAAVIARVRRQAEVGVLADALADESFCTMLVHAMAQSRQVTFGTGSLVFERTIAFDEIAGRLGDPLPLQRGTQSSSNAIAVLGERLFLKAYRRLQPGVNPELEIGRYLTEVAHFRHCAPVAGSLQFIDADGVPTTLALLQQYVSNQDDAWTWALAYVERYLDAQYVDHVPLPAPHPEGADPEDSHASFIELIGTLGARVGELHCAFAAARGEAFDPAAADAHDLAAWCMHAREEAALALEALAECIGQCPEHVHEPASRVLEQRERILARIDEYAAVIEPPVLRTRHHGDLHLGQILLVGDDFLITDFEGDPARPVEQRRAWHTPLRDVAGMLRSFDQVRWSALHRIAHNDEQVRRFAPPAARWLGRTREAFLHGYERATAHAALFASLDAARPLLALLEGESALRALRRDIVNRPADLAIALHGILDWANG